MSYMHYVKLVRDAAVPFDNVIHRLTDEDHNQALRRTLVTFDQMNLYITPHPEDRDVVFGVFVEEFSKAGWGYGSKMATAEEDPRRPVVAMTFRHPCTRTRLGETPKRPWAIEFRMPLPDPSIPIRPELIDYYAARASDIARALMAQQVVDEEGKMPGTPGQGGPDFKPPKRENEYPTPPKRVTPVPLSDRDDEPEDPE